MTNGTPSPDHGALTRHLGKVSLGLGLLCLAGFVALFFLGACLGSFEFRLHPPLSRLYNAINESLFPLAVVTIILGHVSRHWLRKSGYEVGAKLARSGLALGYIAVLLFVMTPYVRREPPRPGSEDRAAFHLFLLHGALSGFANRHVSHTYPARLDQLLVGPEDQYHDKQVEGIYFTTGDPLDASPGYEYHYSPSTPAADGTITAYTILARPKEFGPGGRANFFMDESSVVHWTTQNRPATAGDALWDEGSPPASGFVPAGIGNSVLILETNGDEILKKISVEYPLTPVISTAVNRASKPGEIVCLGDNYAASANLHADRALAFGDASVPPGDHSLWIKRGSGQGWQLVVNKYPSEGFCNTYAGEGDLGSMPLSEVASLKPQGKLAFNLAREGDGFVLHIQLGEKELSANLVLEGDQSIAAFEKAIQFDPKRKVQPQVRQAADEYKRGVALAQAGRGSEAIGAYEKAIQLDPKRFEYYKALDDLLSKRSEWQKAVTLWSQFIALVPDKAQAYCERLGAYSHLHDLPNTLKDGDKACSLGDQECCETMRRFRSLSTSPAPLSPGVKAPAPPPRP